jgi:hypothetical protein
MITSNDISYEELAANRMPNQRISLQQPPGLSNDEIARQIRANFKTITVNKKIEWLFDGRPLTWMDIRTILIFICNNCGDISFAQVENALHNRKQTLKKLNRDSFHISHF